MLKGSQIENSILEPAWARKASISQGPTGPLSTWRLSTSWGSGLHWDACIWYGHCRWWRFWITWRLLVPRLGHSTIQPILCPWQQGVYWCWCMRLSAYHSCLMQLANWDKAKLRDVVWSILVFCRLHSHLVAATFKDPKKGPSYIEKEFGDNPFVNFLSISLWLSRLVRQKAKTTNMMMMPKATPRGLPQKDNRRSILNRR